MIEGIGKIIQIVISILSLLLTYISNRKTIEKSEFYTYITLTEEQFVRKTKLKSNIFAVMLVVIYSCIALNNVFYSLPIKELFYKNARIIGVIVLFIMIFSQYICNYILAFSDIKYLDKKMRRQKRNVSNMDEWINFVIVAIWIVGIVVIVLCRRNLDIVKLIIYSMVMISICVEAVLNSFISLYVKIRCWYRIENIIIRTRTNKNVYENIFNYIKNSNMYEFVYEKENILKRIRVPVDDIDAIEKIVDIKTTYLESLREEMITSSTKKKSDSGGLCKPKKL